MKRIAIFAHSTNPRGSVVHAMQLAEALHDAGEDVTLVAPALPSAGFHRTPRCASLTIPVKPVSGTTVMVATRIAEVAAFLTASGAPRFDVHHAQDPITANALADLVESGRIGGFIRTVHHLDSFSDPRLDRWQTRGMLTAQTLCCVSRLWQQRLESLTGRPVHCVGNGVDLQQFKTSPDESDAELRRMFALPDGPILLALGGVEARKNPCTVLQAFVELRRDRPDARLLIAGGATLLDHTQTRVAFEAELRASGAADAVTLAGVIPDALMAALYRRADALISVSRAEGFGLVALEAMACGTPVVASAIAPFTEHLGVDECVWADPLDTVAITAAMTDVLTPSTQENLRASGPDVAARFSWEAVAATHRPLYDHFMAALSQKAPAYA